MPTTTDRPTREKQLQAMTRTSTGRAEIFRRSQEIRGVRDYTSVAGMFIGQMVADILRSEFPESPQ